MRTGTIGYSAPFAYPNGRFAEYRLSDPEGQV
jgi:hypothetical protein